ncbi:MAG: hypothetical protein ACQCN3_03510 [Candidatus Bathyarchaeia archaeon]|jgi:hypothetical protein
MTSLVLMTNTPANAAAPTVPTAGPLASGVSVNETTVSAHLSFRPNPIGVGQSVLVNYWTSPAPGANRYHPEYIVRITPPNGSVITIEKPSFVADGTQWFEFVPDVNGTWKLQFEFTGTYFPAGRYFRGNIVDPNFTDPTATGMSAPSNYQAVYYKPDTTLEQTLIVQDDMVSSWPAIPLPTDYWTRPVAFENREWWSILGNYPWWGPSGIPEEAWQMYYPGTTSVYNPRSQFTPWVQGPNSAHVVWKRMLSFEGIVGGDAGIASLGYELSGYGGKPSIILFGRGYQTISRVSETSQAAQTCWQCYDIRTGEVFWERPLYAGESAPNLIEYGTQTFSGSGVVGADIIPGQPSLLSISNGYLRKYNPLTGAMTGNISIAPLTTGTYYMNGYCLTLQNSGSSANPNYRLINWTTIGSGNFASRIISNTSYTENNLPQVIDYSTMMGANISDVSDGTGSYSKMRIIGFNLRTGEITFNKIIEEPQYSGSSNIADHGKIAVLSARGYYVALDLATGNIAWTGEQMAYPWDSSGFGTYGVQSAYGMLFREAYSGVYAFDWDTGKIVWKFESPATFPYEGSYTNENGTTVYPFDAPAIIADGKMFVYNSEHTPATPYIRGWKLYAINITNGEKVWDVMIPGAAWFSGTDLAVSDGYLSVGGADGYQYIIGRGLSATTVTTSSKTPASGTTIQIEGTVLDQSPAQPGTPCVSHDSMGTQMNYLHRQQPQNGITGTETITGVPVTLTAIDPNGNPQTIDTVTTNGYYGTFSCAWTPNMEGKWTIIASFAADDSYGSSSAATDIEVGAAPQSTEPTTSAQAVNPPYELYTVGTGLAVILVVVIATALLLRKRP